MRYFVHLAYSGTNYFGWQKQPKQNSVQSELEKAFSVVLQDTIQFMGCGRTDTGVHASNFYAHFDFEGEPPNFLIDRMNKVLPRDIAVFDIFEVDMEKHTRFDAFERTYEYHITFRKDPFKIDQSYFFPWKEKLDFDQLQKAASLLLNYYEFLPFCKTRSDAKTMICELKNASWEINEFGMVFHISANRFLRGMVRLIVGMCLNVGLGKISIKEVETALKEQIPLARSESAPPQGLFLTDVKYPYLP